MTLRVLSRGPGSPPRQPYGYGQPFLPRAEQESVSGALRETADSFCLSAPWQSICHTSRMWARLRCSVEDAARPGPLHCA